MRKGSTLRALTLVTAAAGALLVFVLLPVSALKRARREAKIASCANNLQMIGMAYHQYVRTFGGGVWFPEGSGSEKLARMVGVPAAMPLLDWKTMVCPSTEKNPDALPWRGGKLKPNECSYSAPAKDRLKEEEASSTSFPLGSDDTEGPPHHPDGMNVLYGDGHVEWSPRQMDLPSGLEN